MTLVLDLTKAEEEHLLLEAARNGLAVEQYARQRLGLPVPDRENQAIIALLRQWREEDASMSSEEAEEAETEWAALKTNLNSHRTLNGEEPLF